MTLQLVLQPSEETEVYIKTVAGGVYKLWLPD